MSIKSYIKRGLQFILHGTPVLNTNVEAVKLSKSELLKGRNALITGGTSGIGYSIAEAFLIAGANVIITGRNENRLEAAVKRLSEIQSSSVRGIILDNANVEDTTNTLKSLLSEVSIDLLVNNAGINGGLLSTCSEKEYQAVMDTNLKGAVFVTRLVTDNMIKNAIKGNVLNICSSSSNRPANTAYVLSKWGLRGYTLGLAKQLIKHGIVVNGLAPGPTATPMLLKGDNKNLALLNNPSGRYALPEEIANMAVVLTSGIGRMVVGDIVYMTGGAGVITFDDINY